MLKCTRCGKRYHEFRTVCDCGGTLEVVNRFEGPFEALLGKEPDIRRYRAFLPVNHLPDLLVPVTPLVGPFKLEYLTPTGSFKDRGSFVTVGKLKEEGFREVYLDSSGNAAISMGAFGSREGLKVHVFIPAGTSEGKKAVLRALGVDIHEVSGDRMETHRVARKHEPYVSHWYNPYFLEGTKTAAFELYEQLGKVEEVFVPTGSGSLFLGLYKGFRELREMGAIEELPRLVAVQAEGFESLCDRSERKNILGEGIAIPEPPRKEEMMRALKETNGFCVSVGMEETRKALKRLYSMGLIVEPTSALAYAAYLREGKGERAVVMLTGSGLKSSFP